MSDSQQNQIHESKRLHVDSSETPIAKKKFVGADRDGYYERIWNTVELEPIFKKEVELAREVYDVWSKALDNVIKAIREHDEARANARKEIGEILNRCDEVRKI
jgi:hypothetical protein